MEVQISLGWAWANLLLFCVAGVQKILLFNSFCAEQGTSLFLIKLQPELYTLTSRCFPQ